MEPIDLAAMAMFAGGAVALLLVLGVAQAPAGNRGPRLLAGVAIVGVVVIGGAVAISGLQVSLVMAAALSLGAAGVTAVSLIRSTPEERDRQRVLAWILIVAAVMAGSFAIAALVLGAGSNQ